MYLWLKSNIEKYTFTGESCGVKEEFCELFSANESVMDFKDLNQAELCYDMLVYNFYNNIAGYRNGFADCEITSENLDCYFLETSEGILPIGYYKSIRPVEASMLTQEFIDAGIAKIPDKKRELNEEWKMQASIVKEKYEEVKDKKHSSYRKAVVFLCFGIALLIMSLAAFVLAGGFGVFSAEKNFFVPRLLPILRRADVIFVKVYVVLAFIFLVGATVFAALKYLEIRRIVAKNAAEDVINNFDAYMDSINEIIDSDIATGIDDIRFAVRQGKDFKIEKNNALEKIKAFENILSLAKSYWRQLYIYIDDKISIAVIVLCLVMSISYTGVVPAITEGSMYKDALAKMENGSYSEAVLDFESLGNYKDSKAKIRECKYLMAKELLTTGSPKEAKDILLGIGKYKDTPLLIKDCDYEIALDNLDAMNPDDAYDAFVRLGNYKASKQNLKIAQRMLYDRGVEYYRAKQYSLAEKDFKKSVNYGREKDYLFLIKSRDGNQKRIPGLLSLMDFEDVKDILMSDEYLPEFLLGFWTCDDKHFSISRENQSITCTQNILEEDLGDNVRILSGKLYRENTTSYKLRFKIIDENTIKILDTDEYEWYEFKRN